MMPGTHYYMKTLVNTHYCTKNVQVSELKFIYLTHNLVKSSKDIYEYTTTLLKITKHKKNAFSLRSKIFLDLEIGCYITAHQHCYIKTLSIYYTGLQDFIY